MGPNDRQRRALFGALASALHTVVQTVLQIAIVPLVISRAGRETVGGFAAVMQLLGYLSVIDYGISCTLSRYLARFESHDTSEYASTFSEGLRITVLSNFCCGFLVLCAIPFVPSLLNIPLQELHSYRVGLSLLAIWFALRGRVALYGIVLCARQYLTAYNLSQVIGTIARTLVTAILLILGLRINALLLGTVVGESVAGLCCAAVSSRLALCRSSPNPADIVLRKELILFTAKTLLLNLAGRLWLYSDVVVAAAIAGPGLASVYYTTKMCSSVGWSVIFKITESSAPAINQLVGSGDYEYLASIYLRLHKYLLLVAVPYGIAVALFNRPFVTVWVGSQQYGGGITTAMFAGLVPILAVTHLNTTVLQSLGQMRVLVTTATIQGIATAALAVTLGSQWSTSGVAAALVITSLGGLVPTYLHLMATLHVTFKRMWRDALRPSLRVATLLAASAVLVSYLCVSPLVTYSYLITAMVIYSASWLFITATIGLRSSELKQLAGMLCP